jgi:hypothetical protein
MQRWGCGKDHGNPSAEQDKALEIGGSGGESEVGGKPLAISH